MQNHKITMEDFTISNLLKPIEEKEREILQNKLCEQRLELEEKKRQLEELLKKNEKNIETTEDSLLDDIPDPDKMLQDFLESLEKTNSKEKGKEWNFEKENSTEPNESEIDNIALKKDLKNITSNNAENIFQNFNTSEESLEQPSIFRSNTTAKLFNFKISKLNTTKTIGIEPKNINRFDKSIQVNLLGEASDLITEKTKKTKQKILQKKEVPETCSRKHVKFLPGAKIKQKKRGMEIGKKKKKKKNVAQGKKAKCTELKEKGKKEWDRGEGDEGQDKEKTKTEREKQEGQIKKKDRKYNEEGEEDEEEDEEEEEEEEEDEEEEEEDDDDEEDGEDDEEEGEEDEEGGDEEGSEEEREIEIEGEGEGREEARKNEKDKKKVEGSEEESGQEEKGKIKERKTKRKSIKKLFPKKEKNRVMNEEQKNYILHSPNFIKFIENTSKIVERTLGEQGMFNTMFDFETKDLTEESESAEKLKMVSTYYCKKYTNTRPIADVGTSNIYNELFLAAYGLSETATSIDPDGCVLVWNTAMNNRPEYVFTSQSAVCTALFNKFNPHVIIGGTYTGTVVLWDIRAKNKPVQKTILSSQGHMHPIYCAEVVGTKNAHNLVTADTDGRLCKWSLNMFTSPSDTVDLKKGSKEVSCCCFSFQEGEINTFYGGAEDGSLFQAQIHGTKVGVTDSYNVHQGPLTATQFHPLIEGTNDHIDLILTASVDWTCKLLSIRNPTKPLLSIDAFEDYLMDVKWNPVNPGIFASCSCNGKIKLWNISNDLECPYFETSVNTNSTNKIAWSHEGKKLLVADTLGYLTLWNASNDIYQPKSEDISSCEEVIIKLKSGILNSDSTEIEL